jgi:hypothetical protein
LPSFLKQSGTSLQDQNLLSFENLKTFNMVLHDLWEIERNETEWLRIENLKKLFVTIERELIE